MALKSIVLSVLVENSSGVLSRVSGLFSRRGYNIDSITAGITQNPDFTRITIVTSGEDEDVLEQIRKQVEKLVDVVEIVELAPEESVCRELILVTVEADARLRPQVIAIADIFKAKIVDVAETSMMLELTGDQSKLESFLHLINDFRILQIARTGITALPRGRAGETDEGSL